MIQWRDTARPPQLFAVDARAAFALLLVILHIALWTVGIAVLVMAIAIFMEQRGYTPPMALRAVRSLMAGKRRPTTDLGVITTGAIWRRRWSNYR